MITPQDIKEKTFEKALFGGYDMAAVDSFLEEISGDLVLLQKENAMLKAQAVMRASGLPAIADDSGLEVDILGGAPGVETARYAGPERDADANIDKLLSEMARREKEAAMARTNGLSTAKAQRTARFRTSVTLIIDGEMHFFDGIMEGSIAREKAGKGGFGYDPVFIPDGYDVTAAEITEEEKNAISHRGKALRAMAEYLKSR